jgi:hypothetical protein
MAIGTNGEVLKARKKQTFFRLQAFSIEPLSDPPLVHINLTALIF